MNIGDLYMVRHKWLLPFGADAWWKTCDLVVYLGENIANRDDGIKIINHSALVDGEVKIFDTTFLRFLEPHCV